MTEGGGCGFLVFRRASFAERSRRINRFERILISAESTDAMNEDSIIARRAAGIDGTALAEKLSEQQADIACLQVALSPYANISSRAQRRIVRGYRRRKAPLARRRRLKVKHRAEAWTDIRRVPS